MSAVLRTWLSTHSARGAALGLVAVLALTWAVGRGVIADRLTNPLGETYASLSVTLILPVLAVALLPVALHDRVEPSMALAVRPLVVVRAGWWLSGVVLTYLCLAPVQAITGFTQLGVDVLLLTALSTFALCAFGLGPALVVPLLVLAPHLARRTGAPPRWWTVLATAHGSATLRISVGLAVVALGLYAWVGPRSRPDLAGGGID